MSLPRLITPDPAGGLPRIAPVPEVAVLRGAPWRLDERMIDGALDLEPTGDRLEVRAVFDLERASACGLVVRATPDAEEATRLGFARQPTGGALFVDRAAASLDPSVDHGRVASPLELGPAEPLELRVFLDASVIEVYANGRATLSTRVYPTRADALGLALFATDGVARLRTLEAWPMAAA
jgi:beta-fructofuranosidase